MKRLLALMAVLTLVIAMAGCSDNNPVSNNTPPPANTTSSTWDAAGAYWRTTVDASSYTNYMYFSFTTKDTVSTGVPKPTVNTWELGFRREVIKLDGGASSGSGGDAIGTDLGEVDFGAVAAADTAGKSWTSDEINYFISDWYSYNPNTHQLLPTGNVYSMVDAGGHNYVKFRIDSFPGAGMPPDMGTVWITYYFQPTADSKSLPGPTSVASIPIESGTGYFDFSTGTTVTPTNAASSLDWDLAFSSYNVMQNSGPNGSGSCKAFQAYTELTNPTDIDAFTTQPAAPMFADIPSSALTDWYNYTGPPLHQLLTKNRVYVIASNGKLYKIKIESYYKNISGVPTSGYYTFIWKEL